MKKNLNQDNASAAASKKNDPKAASKPERKSAIDDQEKKSNDPEIAERRFKEGIEDNSDTEDTE